MASGDGANQHRVMTVTKDLNTGLRFGFLIHEVSRLRRVVVDRALKPLGITRSQWWVLAFLSRRDGLTQTALASDLDPTMFPLGELLHSTKESGFVEPRSAASARLAPPAPLTRAAGSPGPR